MPNYNKDFWKSKFSFFIYKKYVFAITLLNHCYDFRKVNRN